MKLLIFEWLTGGGLWQGTKTCSPDHSEPSNANQPPAESSASSVEISSDSIGENSMSQQGLAMLMAVTTDFLDAGIEVVTFVDSRLEIFDHPKLKKVSISSADELKTNLAEYSQKTNHVILIAPESNSCLLDCIQSLGPMQHKLISPDLEFATIASCKQTTALRLEAATIDLFPSGMLVSHFLAGTKRFDHPGNQVVLKPIDGAGSENVYLISDWDNSKCHNSAAFAEQRMELLEPLKHVWQHKPEGYRIEAFVSGTPVSVSLLCGASDSQILAPTIQVFDAQPFGEYVKAETDVPADISLRAIQLATKVVNALPKTRGYIGLDMVISDQSSEEDVLIEINPRMTMSYLQLRELYPGLAMSMFKKAVEGKKK
ncbi:MAG: ATP-grasp domain-containing protein [Mariniblastus sp.]